MNNRLYLEIALLINRELYTDGMINYQDYKIVENKILGELGKE